MKSLLGGSAALTVALLASSLLFTANPLVAEPNAAPLDRTYKQKDAPVLVASAAAPEDLSVTDISLADDSLKNISKNRLADAGRIIPKASSGGSKTASLTNAMVNPTSAPAAAQSFVATAYSLRGRTASGLVVGKGMIAADHSVLPLGSSVRIEAGSYTGVYLVADTGGGVRGRRVDVWMPSSGEACRFGRRNVRLTVLSYGKRAASRARR